MRAATFATLATVLQGGLLTGPAFAAEEPVVAPRPITSAVQLPRFQGSSLPKPPMQGEPWVIPEADLPAKVLLVVHTLFEQGLADPRGCEYREIVVTTGGAWRGHATQWTHGWLFPRETEDAPAFAVCWNGLVTPVRQVGERVSLADDFAKKITSLEKARRKQEEKSSIPFHGFYRDATTGFRPPVSSGGIAVCLLLRLGETEKAERLYRVITPSTELKGARKMPYLSWARDWLWFGYYHSILAFGRGDDKLALLGMKQVMDVYSKVASEAKKQGVNIQTYFGGQITTPYAPFLRQAPTIIDDLQRRIKAGQTLPTALPPSARTPAFATFVKALAKQPTAKLIKKLQNAHGRRWSNPGGISWGGVPEVLALHMQGTKAVPELLDAWESDGRLTRTANPGMNFHRSRYIPTVRSVVEDIVQWILDNPSLESVAEARKYWEENKARDPAERWYHTLLDDDAGREAWLNAAENIVENEAWRSSGAFTMTKRPAPGKKLDLTLRGESLRSKTNPSVLELFTKRAEQLSSYDQGGSRELWKTEAACSLAMAAVRWDEDKALPLLKNQFDRTLAFALENRDKGENWNRDEELAGNMTSLTLARLKLGDPKGALHDFADFLDGFDPDVLGFEDDVRALFEPIWRYPKAPTARLLARELFTPGDSPWVPFLQNTAHTIGTARLLSGPLLGVDAFREHLLTQLADTRQVGMFLCNPRTAPRIELKRVRHPDEEGYYRLREGWISNELFWARGPLEINPADPLAPTNGDKIFIRVCDVYAAAISRARGMPWFAWYWPMEQREAARKELIARLKRYGARYAYNEELSGPPGLHPRALMTFPTLDHPATPENVRQGRAIFSLGDDHKRRIVEGLNFPITARWTTLREHPYQQRSLAKSGKHVTKVKYYQEGRIWQAEEVLIDGQWRRFYGFVGADVLTKVRAEEIEILEKKPWMSLQ